MVVLSLKHSSLFGNDTLLVKIKHKLYIFCSNSVILPTLMSYQPILIMHVFATFNFGTRTQNTGEISPRALNSVV